MEVDIKRRDIKHRPGGSDMAALNLNALFFNHEISFCKVYNAESKDRLVKLLFSNRISFSAPFSLHIFQFLDEGNDDIY